MSSEPASPARLGVGFVGAGPVVQAIHLPTLRRLDDQFTVAHVMDINTDLAARVAEPWGARSSGTLQDVLDDPAVDAVAICSPSHLHAEQAIAACRAGKRAVLVEKPYAVTADQAHELTAIAREHGTVVLVGAMHLYDPGWIETSEVRAELRTSAHTIRSSIVLPSNSVFEDAATEISGLRTPGAPTASSASDTIRGGLLGLAVHDLPLIRQQLPRAGSPDSLATMKVLSAQLLEPAGYLVRLLIDGILLEIYALLPSPGGPDWTLTVIADDMALTTDFTPSYVHAGSAVSTLRTSHGESRTRRHTTNGYTEEWLLLHASVTGNAPAPELRGHVADLLFTLTIADRVAEHLAADDALENAS